MTTLRFFYNGIKAPDGRLQKCWYSDTPLRSYPVGTITIYARDYNRFSSEVRAEFIVENESDMMTDYCEGDSIRVEPNHPLYAQVLEALEKCKAHNARRYAA